MEEAVDFWSCEYDTYWYNCKSLLTHRLISWVHIAMCCTYSFIYVWLQCCVCQRKSSNNISLMKHLIMHAQSENQFLTELSDLTQCKYCLKSFPTPFSMQTHVEEVSTFALNLDAFVIDISSISLVTLYSNAC